jgi:hypothetical protein
LFICCRQHVSFSVLFWVPRQERIMGDSDNWTFPKSYPRYDLGNVLFVPSLHSANKVNAWWKVIS